MILNKQPLTLAEARTYLKPSETKRPIDDYFKAFTKLTKDKADKLMEEIKALNNPKLNEDAIVKIADVVPKDSEDVNKIVTEATLTEEETNAILEITKKY